MASAYIPKMIPVPKGATKEEREKLYKDYVELLRFSNPNSFNSNGTLKSIGQRLKKFLTFD